MALLQLVPTLGARLTQGCLQELPGHLVAADWPQPQPGSDPTTNSSDGLRRAAISSATDLLPGLGPLLSPCLTQHLLLQGGRVLFCPARCPAEMHCHKRPRGGGPGSHGARVQKARPTPSLGSCPCNKLAQDCSKILAASTHLHGVSSELSPLHETGLEAACVTQATRSKRVPQLRLSTAQP